MIEMFRDLTICILSSVNIVMFTFIGLNSAAFSKAVAYEAPNHEQELAFDVMTSQLQEYLIQESSQYSAVAPETLKGESKPLKQYIAIPKLNVLAPIGYQENADQDDIRQILESGALSLSPFTPPEENGQTIIFGHSSDYSWNDNEYGTLFTLLPQLNTGDVIKIVQERTVYRYQVDQTMITDASLSELPQQHDNQIVLSTCYPIGFFQQRFNVIATPL